ncbi:sn-glycerol-1-phosphate dehydrogenase [Tardisphaera saccharovorans]
MNEEKSKGIHDVLLPEKVAIGPGLSDAAREYINNLTSGGKVLFVHGKSSYLKLSGVLSGLALDDVEVGTPPSLAEVLAASQRLRLSHYSAVVSIGGGSIIDTGKFLSLRLGIPNVSIPTSLSHDGIASPRASLRSNNGPTSMAAKVPRAVFVDLGVATSSPHRFAAAGFGDTVAKKTAVLDWKLASEKGVEDYGDYSAALAELSAEHVLRASSYIANGSEFGVRVLAEALVSSGIAMAIAGSSRPASGSEHLFAHALQLLRPDAALHGEMCGVGTIMMAKLHGIDWENIRLSLQEVGAPVDARGLGVADIDIIRALTIANKINNRYTILSEGLTFDAAEKLARSTKVIA